MSGSYTVFYVDPATGSNINAGDNKTVSTTTGGTYTQGGGAGGTDIFLATGGTPFSTAVVGDWVAVYADAATLLTFLGRITAVNVGGLSIDISLTAIAGVRPTTGAGKTATIGGKWAGPTGAVGYPILPLASFSTATNAAGDIPYVAFLAGGAGGIDSAITANIANNVNGPYVLAGYKTSVGDGAANPSNANYKYRIDGSTSVIILASFSCTSVRIEDFVFSNNGTTGTNNGINSSAARNMFSRVVVHDVRNNGFGLTATCLLVECEAYLCNGANTAARGGFSLGSASGIILKRCIAHDNAGSNTSGFYILAVGTFLHCIADTNGLYGYNMAATTGGYLAMYNSDAYNNVNDGLRLTGAASITAHIENCNFESNGTGGTGYGINRTDVRTDQLITVTNCAFFGNQTGETNGLGPFEVSGSITNGGSQYSAPTTGNFTITGSGNKNTGRGNFCQTQASYTGTLGYPYIGAAEPQASAGGGLIRHPGMAGGLNG